MKLKVKNLMNTQVYMYVELEPKNKSSIILRILITLKQKRVKSLNTFIVIIMTQHIVIS